jgi:ubiquinone/menaquinone biosynthesis C-methylase UbiE
MPRNLSYSDPEISLGFTTKGVFPYKWAFTLLLPLRNIVLSAEKLINRLDIKENHCVLEVGPGPGYFSIPVAQRLKAGKLYLADIQPEMLAFAERRMKRKQINNVEYSLCNGRSFDFESNFFDIIFLVTVIGEVENKEAYINEFKRMLKPNGIISITELAGDPDKMNIEQLTALFEKHNFFLDEWFGSKRNFTLNFKKSHE